MNEMSLIPGVLSVALVFHHFSVSQPPVREAKRAAGSTGSGHGGPYPERRVL
jgi:hypothetical protein